MRASRATHGSYDAPDRWSSPDKEVSSRQTLHRSVPLYHGPSHRFPYLLLRRTSTKRRAYIQGRHVALEEGARLLLGDSSHPPLLHLSSKLVCSWHNCDCNCTARRHRA
jgi:hypothetical protein